MAGSAPFNSPFSIPPSFYNSPPQASVNYMTPTSELATAPNGEIGNRVARLNAEYEYQRVMVLGAGFGNGPCTTALCPAGRVPVGASGGGYCCKPAATPQPPSCGC